MSEYIIPTPTAQEIDEAVAKVRSFLQLHDHVLWMKTPNDPNLIVDRFSFEDKCVQEINNLMLIWTGDYACDADLIIDRLTSEERANLYLAVVPGWIYPDTMHKLLHAVERPKRDSAA
jgi:hypothetical protein